MANVQSATITVMIRAARKAARNLKRDYGEVDQLQVSAKGPADFVTAADLRAEKILREALSFARPEYGILTEELGEIKGEDPKRRWIIDPISIALEENNSLSAGVIYEPINDQMFWAEKGNGAWANDRRLRVSARNQMNESIFATGNAFLGRGDYKTSLKQTESIVAVSAGIRRFGSAALDLAYVAAGRFDGFWETGLKPWDIAAGIILVREAGGIVSELTGREDMMKTGSIVAANPHLHKELSKTINSVLR